MMRWVLLFSFVVISSEAFAAEEKPLKLSSKLYFEMEHLELARPMWVGLEVELPADAILLFPDVDSRFSDPIISMDVRKYLSLTGTYYPAPERIERLGQEAVVGAMGKVLLLFRLEATPEFRERSRYRDVSISYSMQATMCYKNKPSCRKIVSKGSGYSKVVDAPASSTPFASEVAHIIHRYPVSYQSGLFKTQTTVTSNQLVEIIIQSSSKNLLSEGTEFDFFISGFRGVLSQPKIQRLDGQNLKLILQKTKTSLSPISGSGLLTISRQGRAVPYEIRFKL